MLAQGRKKVFRSIMLHCRLLLAGALLLVLVLVTPAAHARPRPDYSQFVTMDADGHLANEHGSFLGYGTNLNQHDLHDPLFPGERRWHWALELADLTLLQEDLASLSARGYTHIVLRSLWGMNVDPDRYIGAGQVPADATHETMMQKWRHALDLIEANGMYCSVWIDGGGSWPDSYPGEWRYDLLWRQEGWDAHLQYIEEFVNEFKDRKCILSWRIENEGYPLAWEAVALQPPELLNPFHDFLTDKYGDVATLNAQWGSSYGDISDIPLPDQAAFWDPLLMEYNYFREAFEIERNNLLSAEYLSFDPNHMIFTSQLTRTGGAATLFECHQLQDIDNVSLLANGDYPDDYTDGGYGNSFDSILHYLVTTRRIGSHDIPVMISEVGYLEDDATQAASDYILTNWLDCVGDGGACMDIWESSDFIYTSYLPDPNTVALQEMGAFTSALQGVDTKFTLPDPNVLVLRNNAVNYSLGYIAESRNYRKVGDWLYQTHVPFDVLTESNIDATLLEGYKAIFISNQDRLFDDATWLMLRNWIESVPGRVLITTYYDELDSHFKPKKPSSDMEHLMGFPTATYSHTYDDVLPRCFVFPQPFGTVPAGNQCSYTMFQFTMDIPTPLAGSAQAIAERSDMPGVPLLVENTLSNGNKVYTFALSFTDAEFDDPDCLSPVVKEMLASAGVTPAFEAPSNLGVFVADDQSAILFKERYSEATDQIFSGDLGGGVYDADICEINASGNVTLRESIRAHGWRIVKRLPITIVPTSGIASVSVTPDSQAVLSCSVDCTDQVAIALDGLIGSQNYEITIDGDPPVTQAASGAGGMAFNIASGAHTVSVQAVAGAGTVVSFPDAGLETAIRAAIGRPSGEIYDTDLTGLNQLKAPFASISDLSGIGYCTGLVAVDLVGNPLSDLTPLQSLTQLSNLRVADCGLVSLSGLSGLVNIEVLDISNNLVSDLGALENLTLLKHLYANDNQIADLSGLEALPNLYVLLLDRNDISDISPLTSNSALGANDLIRLEENPLLNVTICEDVAALKARGVTVLHDGVCHTAINFGDPNIEAAARAAIGIPTGQIYDTDLVGVGFDTLNLPNFGISDLSGLEYCLDLAVLDLSGNPIGDITPLATLTEMGWLTLNACGITDITPLAGMTKMSGLSIKHNAIKDLSPLADMTDIVLLFTEYNQIIDLSVVENMPNLEGASFSVNYVYDLSPLLNSGLGSGETVDLWYNPLGQDALCTDIPDLESRGVTVNHNGSCGDNTNDPVVTGDAGMHGLGSALNLCVSFPAVLGEASYQWLFNGELIDGATNECFNVPALSEGDEGWYACIVTDESDIFMTAPTYVTVSDVPVPTAGTAALAVMIAACLVMGLLNLRRKTA